MTIASDGQRKELSEALRAWFRGRGQFKSMKELAQACGIPYTSLRDYFGGRSYPRSKAREKLYLMTGIASLRSGEFGTFSDPLLLDLSKGTVASSSQTLEPHVRRFIPMAAEGSPDSSAREGLSRGERAHSPIPPEKGEGLMYKGYMATALTNLERAARIGVIFISDCVATVCKEHAIDLYEPRKATDPVNNATIQDHVVYLLDRKQVTTSDVVIVLCEYPSFGAGQEIEIAGNATVPLVLLRMGDKKASRMMTGTPVYKVEVTFTDPSDLQGELGVALEKLLPRMQERRRKMETWPVPRDLGERVRALRKQARLDPDELADQICVSEQFVKNLEKSPSNITNLSLIQISALAGALKVPFYELFGEIDADRNAILHKHIVWARKRGVLPHDLTEVLSSAARSKTDSSDNEPNEADLDEILASIKGYKNDLKA
ncbi:MAG: helix-turn-helix transcriptional regulator [Planctomycetota bacterium]|nr:helix-turn-helix transcriptional regulator [Planctomycetota bacterium]